MKIERLINGAPASEEELFGERRRNPQAEALLRRIMRRRENDRA